MPYWLICKCTPLHLAPTLPCLDRSSRSVVGVVVPRLDMARSITYVACCPFIVQSHTRRILPAFYLKAFHKNCSLFTLALNHEAYAYNALEVPLHFGENRVMEHTRT